MILTLGDSFTVKRFKGDKPWPEHLAETLGKELMNISHEGETNHYIFRNAIWALNKENISMIVLALSNWDRFEVPYDNYGKEKLGLYEKTKNYKPLPILDDDFYSFYKKHHNIPFYIDSTASYLLSIQEICSFRNIPLVIIQPVAPFHPNSENQIKDYRKKYYDDYVDNKSIHQLPICAWPTKSPHEELYQRPSRGQQRRSKGGVSWQDISPGSDVR